MKYDIRLLQRTNDYNEIWILFEQEGGVRRVVNTYHSRDACVDAWARAAKLPVCSICRYVHGSEIQHLHE